LKDKKSNIEDLIKNAVKENDYYVPQTQPDTVIALLQPQISKKASRLRQKQKEKTENRVFIICYSIFFVFVLLITLNCFSKGSFVLCPYILIYAGVFSALLLSCLPLLIRFKDNINERRTY
jgi:hypothetical protein